MASDLVVHLTANATKFNAAMRSARSTLSKFADYGTKALVPMAAGFAAAAGSVYVLTGRIAKLAAVNDKAIQTGLSGEFIQRLGYAADQSGVSAESLMKAIEKMTVAIGRGNKEFQHLRGLEPEEQFFRVAKSISSIETAAGRAAAAVKIFGRDGIEMTGLFAGGMDDVNKLLDDAKKLGIGLSDEALAKAAKADDSIQRMYASFGALFDQLAIGVAPLFDDISQYITEWIPPITEFFDKFNQLDDKTKWVTDLFVASFETAFQKVQDGFVRMLRNMVMDAGKAALAIHDAMNPQTAFYKAMAEAAVKNSEEPYERLFNNMTDRLKRFANGVFEPGINMKSQSDRTPLGDVLARLKPKDKPRAEPERFVGPQQGFHGVMRNLKQQEVDAAVPKIKSLLSDIGAQVSTQMKLAKMPFGGVIDKAKLDAQYLGGVLQSMFTGETTKTQEEAARRMQPMAAGAMQRGSQEAYSTLVQAMMRTQDPQVKATKEGTKEIVKAIKSQQKPMFNLVNDLMGAVGL